MASLRVSPFAPAARPVPSLLPRALARHAQRAFGAPAAQPAHRRRAQRAAAAVVVVAAAAASTPHLQLATAKLPADVDSATFTEAIYQWAATLTSSGRNMVSGGGACAGDAAQHKISGLSCPCTPPAVPACAATLTQPCPPHSCVAAALCAAPARGPAAEWLPDVAAAGDRRRGGLGGGSGERSSKGAGGTW